MFVLVGRTSGDRKFTDLLHGWPDRVAAVIRLAVTLSNSLSFGRCSLTHDMLIQPLTFVAAFFFTLILNLLSAAIPAWRASRMPITEALHDME